jgi:hypothetical protein
MSIKGGKWCLLDFGEVGKTPLWNNPPYNISLNPEAAEISFFLFFQSSTSAIDAPDLKGCPKSSKNESGMA